MLGRHLFFCGVTLNLFFVFVHVEASIRVLLRGGPGCGTLFPIRIDSTHADDLNPGTCVIVTREKMQEITACIPGQGYIFVKKRDSKIYRHP